jgi:DNA polymerase-4
VLSDEPLSLDEAYLDVTDSPHFAGSAAHLRYSPACVAKLHITVSAGV